MFERKSLEINLFDRSFFLYERSAGDVISLAEFSLQSTGNDIRTLVYKALDVVESSLKYNYIDLPWYKFFYKIKLRHLLSKKNLIKSISQQQIFAIAKSILEMEGLLNGDVGEKKKTT